MGKQSSTQPSKQPSTQLSTQPPPPLKKSNKFIKFTKKASKIAGDIAFGNAYDNAPQIYHPYIPQLTSQTQRNKPYNSIEYNTKLANLINATKFQCMNSYLDYLKFFLNYMDESEVNDVFDYSITRNSLWNQWLFKNLTNIQDILNAEILAPSDSSSINSSSTTTSSSTSTNPPSLPTIDQINKELFQDQRIVLLLLWNNQILNKISSQHKILTNLLNHHPPDSEICIITSNKLKSYKYLKTSSLSKLFKLHSLPSQLELIDGWQLRHDFPNFKTNLVNLTDKFQIILDLKDSGYLKPSTLKNTPHFNDFKFLDSDFINSKFHSNEKTFIQNYSSFTAPSILELPFKSKSQNLLYFPDFTRLINCENDVVDGIKEFNRILKSNGSLFIILFDILSFKHISTIEHDCNLAEYIQIYLNYKISKFSKLPNLSELLIKYLNGPSSGFKDVQFIKLGIPVIDYRDLNLEDSPSKFNSPSTTSRDLPYITDNPISSMYATFSSYIEYLRIQKVFDLQSISVSNDLSHLTNEMMDVLKLWISWKLNGFENDHLKYVILNRLKDNVNDDGYDTELGVRLMHNRTPGNNIYLNKRIVDVADFYIQNSNQSGFMDGLNVGIDFLYLITAIKKDDVSS